MKVVLTQDHDTLGMNGSIVDVSEGYARNFLLPQNLAVRATSNVIKHFEDRKKATAKKEAAKLDKAKAFAQELSQLSVNIEVRVGEEGKLYGTVTAKDIAAALSEQHQQEFDKKQVDIPAPIRQVGEHQVKLKVHPQVKADLKVVVAAAQEADE